MHHEFYQLAKKIIQHPKDASFALATVIQVRGSAYRREGTRMIIGDGGNWYGNISGGCLEGDILRKAQQVISKKDSILVTYDTRESKNKEIRIALGCNGVIDILIEPVNNAVIELCNSIVNLFEKEQNAYLYTQIQLIKDKIHVTRKINNSKPSDFPPVAFENENLCHVENSEFIIHLFEFIGLQRKIVVWGAGPDVLPLARFASQLGWKTVVASDCGIENLTSLPKDVNVLQVNFDDFEKKISIHQNTALLLVSHDFYKDYFILEKIIHKDVKYIGIMGPKRRGDRMIREFKKRNPNNDFNENILHYPVGLDIGSDNPTEIALSIIAEVQAHFSGKDATPLRDKTTRIHRINSSEITEEFNPTDITCAINNFQ
jgi:xanthine/CO dehydrogenase XdhC/CoxF family maturation factor